MRVSDNSRGRPRSRVERRPGPGSHPRGEGGVGGNGTIGRSLGGLPVWQVRLAGMAAFTLPGVLLRNDHLEFRCDWQPLRVENAAGPWLGELDAGQTIRLPIITALNR